MDAGCGSATITDLTGTYNPADPDENPGGYAPTGTGTGERPEYLQTVRLIVWRRRNVDGTWTDFVVLTQTPYTTTPFTYDLPLLDEDGEPYTSAAWQVFMVVLPFDFDFAQFVDDGGTLEDLVVMGMDDGAVGQKAMWPNCTPNECLNNANMDFNNAWTTGGCKCGAYETKLALYTGVGACLAVGQAYTTPTLLAPVVDEWYQKAEFILTQLLTNCSTPECGCSCG